MFCITLKPTDTIAGYHPYLPPPATIEMHNDLMMRFHSFFLSLFGTHHPSSQPQQVVTKTVPWSRAKYGRRQWLVILVFHLFPPPSHFLPCLIYSQKYCSHMIHPITSQITNMGRGHRCASLAAS